MKPEPTVLGWKKVAKKHCANGFLFPVYKWVIPASANKQRAVTKYISFTPKTNTGLHFVRFVMRFAVNALTIDDCRCED